MKVKQSLSFKKKKVKKLEKWKYSPIGLLQSAWYGTVPLENGLWELKDPQFRPKTATQMTRQATKANKHYKGIKWGHKSYSVSSKEGRMGE